MGLINGGVGVRLDTDFPAGEPQVGGNIPLFLFANDLEMDFPALDCVQLVAGRVANLVNCYVQGAGAGYGIRVLPTWGAEFQLSNSRLFGNALAGVHLGGGVDAVISGNILDNNGLRVVGPGAATGVEVAANVSQFIISGNAIGPVTVPGNTLATVGIRVASGSSDFYVITNNMCRGHQLGAVSDGGTGPDKTVTGNLPRPVS